MLPMVDDLQLGLRKDFRELYLVWFITTHDKHYLHFRRDELEAVAAMFGVEDIFVEDQSQIDVMRPYAWIRLPSDEVARQILSRCIMSWRIFSVWGQGRSFEELCESLRSLPYDADQYRPYVAAGTTFSFRVKGFGKKYSYEEENAMYKQLAFMPFQGRVQLDRPDFKFGLLFYHGMPVSSATETSVHPLQAAFLGRVVATCDRDRVLNRYRLADRTYLGPTSTDAELAVIMANMVHARPGIHVYDPFVGTGSLLVACAAAGAFVSGSDIDYNILNGKEGKNLFDNFKQYGMSRPDIWRCDASRAPLRQGAMFDVICCDPPYGIRAGAKKCGVNKVLRPIPEEYLECHIPRTQAYDVDDVMNDLLEFSAARLVPGGRLCYLLPTLATASPDEIPRHPRLELVSHSQQVLAAGRARWAVTMVKRG